MVGSLVLQDLEAQMMSLRKTKKAMESLRASIQRLGCVGKTPLPGFEMIAAGEQDEHVF